MAVSDILVDYPILRVGEVEIHFVKSTHAIVGFPDTWSSVERERFCAQLREIWEEVYFRPVTGRVEMRINKG